MLSPALQSTSDMDCIGAHAYTRPVTFGQRVRWYREQRGWSQAYLAKLAGLDGGTINRIEHGRIRTGTKSRSSIAKAFGIPVAALDPDSPPPTQEATRDDTSAFARLDDAQLLTAMAALIKELERRQSRPPSSDGAPPTPPHESPPPRRKRR
jgi:transcriptional regulator with XRE-family HTH domain